MMRNPNAMREAMRHQDIAMSQLENHPEGYNALRRMFETMDQPMDDAATPSASSSAPSTPASPPLTAPNTSALPNPWAAPAAGTSRGTPGTNPFNAMMPNFAMPSTRGGSGAAPGAAGNPFGGMGGMPPLGDPAQMSAMLNNPMVQQMLGSPEFIQQV